MVGAKPYGQLQFRDVKGKRMAYVESARPANHARFVFLDPRASAFYPDWDLAVDSTVDLLRTEAGRNPFDRNLSDLVGELSTRSETFRKRWAAHNADTGQTTNHPS
jgi:hypothetical protein